MQKPVELSKILFLDVETVSQYASYNLLPERERLLWDRKAEQLVKFLPETETCTPEKLYERSGIYAEFGKIICISVAYLLGEELRIKSFYGQDEKQILLDFATLLNKYFNKQDNLLCAHNGKEFDFPYIARRMLINDIKLPSLLQLSGKKPWEVRHLDTLDIWKFGDYKHYTSLDLLAAIFDIPTPKDDIDGSMIFKVFWEENNLERIAAYCEKDVTVLAALYRKLHKNLG